ncbi:MAG: hypothetical protein JO171_02325 [Paludibacterium sp.]|uniref:hypothetical protein n=1 Tax=Paludibacterium sp. TaxID=1917523 RepID=UPI0025EE0E9D|nr:hypothetical protein [Paludibacterium sp.]MBV8045961.1 hypothetical protein [Paludibacterium sp.]MBV8648194.1 hypothetical protein [Paludibacterium sp.]
MTITSISMTRSQSVPEAGNHVRANAPAAPAKPDPAAVPLPSAISAFETSKPAASGAVSVEAAPAETQPEQPKSKLDGKGRERFEIGSDAHLKKLNELEEKAHAHRETIKNKKAGKFAKGAGAALGATLSAAGTPAGPAAMVPLAIVGAALGTAAADQAVKVPLWSRQMFLNHKAGVFQARGVEIRANTATDAVVHKIQKAFGSDGMRSAVLTTMVECLSVGTTRAVETLEDSEFPGAAPSKQPDPAAPKAPVAAAASPAAAVR